MVNNMVTNCIYIYYIIYMVGGLEHEFLTFHILGIL